jgi:hypothetical protein
MKKFLVILDSIVFIFCIVICFVLGFQVHKLNLKVNNLNDASAAHSTDLKFCDDNFMLIDTVFRKHDIKLTRIENLIDSLGRENYLNRCVIRTHAGHLRTVRNALIEYKKRFNSLERFRDSVLEENLSNPVLQK